MSVLKFIKTNWFSIALVMLIVLAIARKNLRLTPEATPAKKEHVPNASNPEKITAEGVAAESASLLGIGSSEKVQMPKVDDAVAMAFFKRFGKVTLEEQKKYGIPASVLLACAYVNSFGGQRNFVQSANNYFALPCSVSWEGQTATVKGHCIRRYATAWESYRDFNNYLSNQNWFSEVKKSAGKDPLAWAKALDNRGASDVENFGSALTEVIREYRLFELDQRK